MIQLLIQGNKLIIKPENLLVPEIKALWDWDKSKDKHAATEWLKYVYLIHNPNSPYSSLINSVKLEKAKKELDLPEKEKAKIPEVVSKLEDVYILYNYTAEDRLILSVSNKIDQLTATMNAIVPTEENLLNIMKATADMPKVLDSKISLLEKVAKINELEVKIRGDKKPNILGTELKDFLQETKKERETTILKEKK